MTNKQAMFRNLRAMMWASLVLLAIACSPRTTVDSAPGVNFTQYKRFEILPPKVETENPRYNSQLILDRITTHLTDELQSKGLQRNGGNPDLIVAYNIHTVEREDVQTTNIGPSGYWWGPWGGWGPWGAFGGGWGWGWGGGYPYWQNQMNTVRYTESTVVLDMVDAHTRKLVWRGTIEGDVTSPQELERNIIRGISSLIEKYPSMHMNGDGLGKRAAS